VVIGGGFRRSWLFLEGHEVGPGRTGRVVKGKFSGNCPMEKKPGPVRRLWPLEAALSARPLGSLGQVFGGQTRAPHG
jgi:hypothetical protein